MGAIAPKTRPTRVIAAALALIAAAPALSEGGVRKAPETNGSLERTFRHCERERDKVVGAIFKTCDFSYFVHPDVDGDPERNYSVEWLQMSVEPLPHRCLAGTRGSIRMEGARIIARVPRRPVDEGPSKSTLRVGSSERRYATLKASHRLASGVASTEVRRSPRSDRLQWRWVGRSDERISLVVGVAFADPPNDPEDAFDVTERLTTVKVIHC
jgi:hypothetical protein